MGIFNKNDDSMNAVACDVLNCVYHGSEKHCNAKSINVGPSYAVSGSDTVCSTFKQK